MLWHIKLKFCIWLCFTVLQIKFECHQFASIFVGVMPPLELRILEMHSFRTFLLNALTYWAEILHKTLLYCTTGQVVVLSICINFCGRYAPFGTHNTENTVFRIFLLHALTYWAEILQMTLFYWYTHKLRVSSICVNFCGSYAPFGT